MEQRLSQRRFLLRSATAAAHEALEQEMGHIQSHATYVRYLSAMTRFRGAIEPNLTTADIELFRPTVIHDWLLLDCEDLRVTGVAPLRTSLDCTGEAGLGVAYVLEGSAMGASLLIRAAQALGFHATYGARHLSRQVERRGNWATFVAHLEKQPTLDMTKVIDAANATFALARDAARDVVHAA